MTNPRVETAQELQNKMVREVNWKLLFSTFLKTPVDELDLEVKDTADKILLATTHRQIAERLLQILNSPERLRASLDYTLTASAQAADKIFR